ncbi:phosphatidylinositol N-acetylglucosaminyltransferase subunit Q [Nephila pilipes]|uniref:Phosphatidylinositol N-acetylglucosaminyltransferase subunit Q n=1 Tax=Nephila pilipes TaxID=299642 RepID=A0A8X6QV17_NEPPI|nr:phosphatidylinositol N-acetylglucosaminyltransferase subunit Q [Nephila pilipes]
MVSVFVPCGSLSELPETCYIFGHSQPTLEGFLINCNTLCKTGSFSYIKEIVDETTYDAEFSPKFGFLGVLYCSKKRKECMLDDFKFINEPISLILRLDNSTHSFYLEDICIKLYDKKKFSCQIILYDNLDLLKSRMFFNSDYSEHKNCENNFVQFLLKTLRRDRNFASQLFNSSHIIFDGTELLQTYYSSKLLTYLIVIASAIPSMLYVCMNLMSSLPSWIHLSSFKILTSTSVGCQLHQRFLHCEKIATEWVKKKDFNLQSKNLIAAILFDLICGWLITFAFLQLNVPLLLFDMSIEQTNNLVNTLQKILYWLMGVPGGLKLNIPLNSALGHFFLYHIYLWEAYMAVVLPVFTLILKISILIGILGVTFVLCLLNDLVSLATIHIYCFYGYAARLYGYQIIALSSLWRLFRGKKWNPLRQRVDSYTYDIHQLFLGTFIFTVLLFLLPTVMIYYFVFTCLRILVLIIQGIISKIIHMINVNPFYCILSRIIRSSEVAGDIYFSVYNTKGTLTLSMEVTQVSFMAVIKQTLPELSNMDEYLSWKDFLSSIMFEFVLDFNHIQNDKDFEAEENNFKLIVINGGLSLNELKSNDMWWLRPKWFALKETEWFTSLEPIVETEINSNKIEFKKSIVVNATV